MHKKILLLGGAGLIAGNLAKHVSEMAGYEVYCVDIVQRGNSDLKNITFLKANVLQKDAITTIIAELQPSIIINGINVATIFSIHPQKGYVDLVNFYINLYKGLLSLTHPFHYIQLGTTGSGGLGLNIPFTHGDKIEHLPIIHKAAFAGITTSMLTLLSRSLSQDAKISEIKPGLSIFADTITTVPVGHGKAVLLNGGESGDYTYNELALLTSFMGFTTVGKIVDKVLGIISDRGKHETIVAHDTISAMNAVIISSEQDDFDQRNHMLEEMVTQQGREYVIATGNLGPPSITRDLMLSYLKVNPEVLEQWGFEQAFSHDPSLKATMAYIRHHDRKLYKYLQKECNHEAFAALGSFYITGMFHPWQVVRAKLQQY